MSSSMFDPPRLRPPFKYQRQVITVAAGVVIVAITIAILLRFHTERATIREFMNALVSENYQAAYKIWKPSPSYSYQDFMQDWGSNGYYGPVKSYRIDNHETEKVRGDNSVAITVELSPFQPFPDESDPVKHAKTKRLVLWVQFSNESLAFPAD
jgi:hypothetical protein